LAGRLDVGKIDAGRAAQKAERKKDFEESSVHGVRSMHGVLKQCVRSDREHSPCQTGHVKPPER
jgi:hypothetical protein